MRVTRVSGAAKTSLPVQPASRPRESALMLAAAVLIAAGLWQVTGSTAADPQGALLLRRVMAPSEIAPRLAHYENPAQRQFIAEQIARALRDRDPANVGAIAAIHIGREDAQRGGAFAFYADRFERSGAGRIRLFTPEEFAARIKPYFAVRAPEDYRASLRRAVILFFACFIATHLAWLAIGFRGNEFLLPAMFFLHGVALILMIGLRDPLRDTAIFARFSRGAFAGCLCLLAITALVHFLELRRRGALKGARALDLASAFTRSVSRRGEVAFIAAVVLSLALLVFGSGPGGSGARVRLAFFQPVEAIRFLLVLFLATYFARRWEFLRELKEKRVRLRVNLPRLDHVLPVVAALALSICFFFLQRDLGPALVLSGLFLCLYAIARRRAGLALLAIAALVGVVWLAYAIGHPTLVVTRVGMWLDPWNNGAPGGDQVAHSIWAMSTGGLRGTGFGHGDPEMIPAGHTDLILAVLGEERGFLGLLLALGAYLLFFRHALRIALRAATDYEFFLAAGLTLALAIQGALIAGGVLGLLPLSGVVTPFLSYGASATIINLVSVGVLLAISAKPNRREAPNPAFLKPVSVIAWALAGFAVLLIGKAAWVQVVKADTLVAAGVLAAREDGSYAIAYNPRLLAVARQIPRGTIYDRTGLPVASSLWDELEKHRTEYSALGIDLDRACSRDDRRHYPFGNAMLHLLGDLRTRWRWPASNARYEERVSRRLLQGFDDLEAPAEIELPRGRGKVRVTRYDYSELVPLLRARMDPSEDAVKKVLDKPRDIRLTLDARLQLAITRSFQEHLRANRWTRGAVVVLDPSTGGLLAAVSLPLPQPDSPESASAQAIDTARFGQYPPGSAFKLVTAIAALRRDPALAAKTYQCIRLPQGRVGNIVRGRPIRDDIEDTRPHGNVDMRKALVESCNAWFSQLGTYDVGAQALLETALLFNIETASPNTPQKLAAHLTQAAYGQGEVLVTPYRMARVAAAIANQGLLAPARFRIAPDDAARDQGLQALAPHLADDLQKAMRGVVVSGTARSASKSAVPIAGKTGTAELSRGPAHAWFAGFAPYGAPSRRQVAFAILVENARYGGRAAAPFAVRLIEAASSLKPRPGQ